MDMEVSEGEFEILKSIPCPSLPYNTPGTTYVLVKIPDDQTEGKSVRVDFNQNKICGAL